MMITNQMLLHLGDVEIESKRVVLNFKGGGLRTEYIFTNGWENSKHIGCEVIQKSIDYKKGLIGKEKNS